MSIFNDVSAYYPKSSHAYTLETLGRLSLAHCVPFPHPPIDSANHEPLEAAHFALCS
jgi:hypothetical protein